MEPLLIIVPGLLGGLLVAVLIRGSRRAFPPTLVPTHLAAPSPSLINMAHIPVDGVGGLGMVGAVVVVAVTDWRIGLATIVALLLGGALALVLVALRRRTGPMPSAGGGPGDRSLLHLGSGPGKTVAAHCATHLVHVESETVEHVISTAPAARRRRENAAAWNPLLVRSSMQERGLRSSTA